MTALLLKLQYTEELTSSCQFCIATQNYISTSSCALSLFRTLECCKTQGLLLKFCLYLQIYRHGLINFKDTKTKCWFYWCLIEFIDWRYCQSCWYFDSALWTIASLTFSLVHLPHPSPFSQSKSTVNIDSVCLARVGDVLSCVGDQLAHSVSDQIQNLKKLLVHPKQKPRRGGGLRQICSRRLREG